jgi:hypothetical protein
MTTMTTSTTSRGIHTMPSFGLHGTYPVPVIYVVPGHITLRDGDLALVMQDEILNRVWEHFGDGLALDAGYVLKQNENGFYGAAVIQEHRDHERTNTPGIILWQSRYYHEEPDSADVLRRGLPELERLLRLAPNVKVLVYRPPDVEMRVLLPILRRLPAPIQDRMTVVKALARPGG